MKCIREDVADAINDILEAHGVSYHVKWDELSVSDKVVMDYPPCGRTLSSAIIDHVWPVIPKCEAFHFTSERAATDIIDTWSFRLSNICRRITDKEIVTFCEAHKLTGYLNNSSGIPYFQKKLARNTYIGSFTSVDIDQATEDCFVSVFGPVRLRFAIEVQIADFRPMQYELSKGSPVPVIAALQECIKSKFQRDWVLAGFSRVCCFYLPGSSYGWEKESRLLWQPPETFPFQASQPGPGGFVSVPLGEWALAGFKMTLTEVCASSPMKVPVGVSFEQRK